MAEHWALSCYEADSDQVMLLYHEMMDATKLINLGRLGPPHRTLTSHLLAASGQMFTGLSFFLTVLTLCYGKQQKSRPNCSG